MIMADPFKIEQQLSFFDQYFDNNVKPVVKKIIFLRIFAARSAKNNRYRYSLVYDALSALSCLQKNELRYCYFSMRSLIENLARVCQNKQDNDETSITELFGELQSLLTTQILFSNDLYSDLRTRYSAYCSFVHNNARSGLDVHSCFLSIHRPTEFSSEDQIEYIKQLDKLLEITISALCVTHRTEIMEKFGSEFQEVTSLLPKKLAEAYLIS